MRVLVVGGGIAGVGIGAFLASHAEVTLAERETTLAYHTTGRSAALFFENYGAGPIRPLTRASRAYFELPPAGLVEHPLLSPRGALTIARDDQIGRLEDTYAEGVASGAHVERISPDDALEICPALRRDMVAAALWEPDAADIDVAGLHQAFVRTMRAVDATITTGAEMHGARHDGRAWRVDVGSTTWEGDVIVDAAGAWGDIVAERCGVPSIGLQPLRRTAFMVNGSAGSKGWPLVVDVDHDWYFKPDGEQILCSLADETPSEPCDARPQEIDVARAIDRINTATHLDIRHVRSQWAGLRTFSADRSMVIGPDPRRPDFFWLVGQGGTGIQTAPAASRLGAALVLGRPVPDDIVEAGLDSAAVSPERMTKP
jgi:D-arginine dehydrogenase